jgi:hypothetical protein
MSELNTEITSGTVQKISTEDYDKQLKNFKSQNEIMKLGEEIAKQKYEKDKITQIVNTELDQDEITQKNILDFLDSYSNSKNKESKLLGLLFRVNVICKDFKKSKKIISKLNETLNSVRTDFNLEKELNQTLTSEAEDDAKYLSEVEQNHKVEIQKSKNEYQELESKYINLYFWFKLYKWVVIYPAIFILFCLGYIVYLH